MGCGSSVPVAAKAEEDRANNLPAGKQQKGPANDEGAPGEIKSTVEPNEATKAKSKSTRARRLSYVQNESGDSGAPAEDVAESPDAPRPGSTTAVRAANNNTRVRRLSYVTNDPNVPAQLAADGPDAGELGGEGAAQLEPQNMRSPLPQAASGQTSGGIHCTMACMSRAGREPGFKKQNQDNCFAFEKYITAEQSLFGAFDGHGPNGHLVSGYVKQHLPIMLVNHLSLEADTKTALQKGFLEVDKALASSRIDCEFSGSTAVVSFLQGKTLTTAWVGDSRGVLGRASKKGGYEAVNLTTDHKPTLPEEKARIIAANGRCERLVDELGQPIGPFRVWLQYAWIPGLAMSRALGDVLAHQVGVTSQPECSVIELTPVDKFIVLASDGVWEFIESQEAIDLIGACETVEEGCRQLVDEAYQRWLVEEEGVVDDITAVVVKFNYTE
ncbi:hypothetical protein WJX72_001084 [[Myrmecia] bisecta]|uniref:PPM-type phosphatase domain-containing protein n=1 Tax=[Myrmecia] bisecta TaxID=41462 RepID=A0AAW1PJK9_9CHLO